MTTKGPSQPLRKGARDVGRPTLLFPSGSFLHIFWQHFGLSLLFGGSLFLFTLARRGRCRFRGLGLFFFVFGLLLSFLSLSLHCVQNESTDCIYGNYCEAIRLQYIGILRTFFLALHFLLPICSCCGSNFATSILSWDMRSGGV